MYYILYKVYRNFSGQTAAYVTYPVTSGESLVTSNGDLNSNQANGQALYQYNPTAFGRGQPPTYPYSFIGNPGTYAARAFVPVAGATSASIGNSSNYQMTQLANVITPNTSAVIGLPDGMNGSKSVFFDSIVFMLFFVDFGLTV